jgi:hypothetical protein
MPKVEAIEHRRWVKGRAIQRKQAFDKDAGYVQDIHSRVPEPVKQAVDIAYRAWGLDQQFHQQGFIGRGDIVRDTIERILTLESEPYQDFVIESIVETSEVLEHLLNKWGYDSGRRKYHPLEKQEKKKNSS